MGCANSVRAPTWDIQRRRNIFFTNPCRLHTRLRQIQTSLNICTRHLNVCMQGLSRPFRHGGICLLVWGISAGGQSVNGGLMTGDVDLMRGDLTLIDYIIN